MRLHPMNNLSNQSVQHPGPSKNLYLWLAIPLGIGWVLRFRHLDHQSLWADEAWAALLAQKSPSMIVKTLLHDSSPPLYYLTLKFWICLFGSSETALRSLSALFSSATLLTAAWLTWRLTKNQLVTFALTAFLALSPTQLYFAQETRAYAMASFLFLFAIAFMIVENQSPGRGWPLIPALILLIYTHNYGWLLWGCYLAWSFRKNLRIHVWIALGSLLWLPGLYIQLTHDTTSWVPPPKFIHFWETLLSFSGKAQFMNTPTLPTAAVIATASLLALLLISAVFCFRQSQPKTTYFLFFGLAPWALAMLLSLRKPMLLPGRHDTLFMAPVLILAVSTVFNRFKADGKMRNRLKTLCTFIAFLVLVGQAVTAMVYFQEFIKANDREVAHQIIKQGNAEQTVVISTDITHASLQYYLSDTGFKVISFPIGEKGSLPLEFLINRRDTVDDEIDKLLVEIHRHSDLKTVIVALAGTVEANLALVDHLDGLWSRAVTLPLESPRPYNSVHHLIFYTLAGSESVDRTGAHPLP